MPFKNRTRFCVPKDNRVMTNNPQNSEHEFTPDEIHKLAKFFCLLRETDKELKSNENQERNHNASCAL